MAVTISFMLQKGGVGKSTTTGILAYLLSRKGKKVLVVDMDSQGNVSTLLSQRSTYTFSNETVLEAIEDQDPVPYIVKCGDLLDLLPSDDLLAIYGRRIYELQHEGFKGSPILYLKNTLDLVKDNYDYILIDCPPSLNEQTTSALSASDYVVTVLQAEVYAYQALARFFETLFHIRNNVNPNLAMIGIVVGLIDRYTLQDSILEECKEEYGSLVFGSVIRRLARIAEFATLGITDSRKDQKVALEQYEILLDELLERIENNYHDNSIYLRALESRLEYVEEKLLEDLPDIKLERFEELKDDLINHIKIAKEWI
ncbi:ParA family protein [Sulfoacidibacillus ferrooxidans]|uniref:Chromosome-partitioning ATPase Soj n=1 Tax=Sulfoacidibacillus ferrooxidans TaxID=2005001 RepID=A0A9X1VA83_9BACL|nr:ParA family protein [Sulfoacidibacillus ferrooxidans]MCI0184248.1 Chromosome-partitioning ATPase Soj [Sulfoacidibacillus ferrooxidans]